MSIKTMSEIWGLHFLNPTQKLVVLALADEVVATAKELADKLDMQPYEVLDILQTIPMTILFGLENGDGRFWLAWDNVKMKKERSER